MKTPILWMLLGLLSAVNGAVQAQETAYSFADAAQQFAAQPKTARTQTYLDTWTSTNNAQHLDERDGCYAKGSGPVTQILEIDASGQVVNYFSDPTDARSECWRNTYLGASFPPPPFAPFYHEMVMH